MPNAFVTGGTGFLGTNLILELLEQGWEVTALHRPSSRMQDLDGLPLRRVSGDVTDAESVVRGMQANPDAVFHMAASLSFWSRNNDEQERINVGGTRNVVEAARTRGARRLVHTSSIAAFGMHDQTIDETTPENASRSWVGYLRTKALAEVEVRRGIERGLDATILNPANILGAYDRTGWAALIRQVHAGKFPGAPAARGSFCHGREVARAHICAVEKGATGENYLLGGADASYLEVAQIAAELCGKKPPRRTMPRSLLKLAGRIGVTLATLTGKKPFLTPEMAEVACSNMICSNDKARRVLDYRPVPLRTMIEESHQWLTQRGVLR